MTGDIYGVPRDVRFSKWLNNQARAIICPSKPNIPAARMKI